MTSSDNSSAPSFYAISSSARQLFLLLRCISFAPKAQVQITKEGIRLSAEDSRVMQGLAFLDKSLFSTYNYIPPRKSSHQATNDAGDDLESDDDELDLPPFQISLPALLETLQIFGFSETKDRWSSRDSPYAGGMNGAFPRAGSAAAFDTRVLGMTGVCRLSYSGIGEPLCIILEESGVTTTCKLVTYSPEAPEEIPLRRDRLAQKIIMRSSWLHDAINELSSTSPTRLTITASPTAPYFMLSSSGPLGSATVEFSKDPKLLETFQVNRRSVNTYKYSLIRATTKAMAIASKVSIRCDEQGVLSLQFMIEVEGGGVSFVDFRFVPFLPEEADEEAPDDEGGEESEEYDEDE
ncbi:Rad1-domain-containing protein [Xylona heveae TC161]|uniref:Rad1-domain-containing protein n=1 Tax=Xylona heveae (strain CBS 132557 / TC161) TaxID=1328760 RepID=A0A165GFA7_XYLHT|nr:Rad1-domain-containing protein [Xylona heveae TC161]KZF22115.1 Rad1-domain-containing protein [Xylona heveae TC161]